MIDFIGLFILIDHSSNKLCYQAVEITRNSLPNNCYADIFECLVYCNDKNEDKNYYYVDMYGYCIYDETVLWEVI